MFFLYELVGKFVINSICCMLINGFRFIGIKDFWYVDWGLGLSGMGKIEVYFFFFF